MDWNNIQIEYNNGLTQKEIIEKYNLSRWFLDKAKKEGKFIIHKYKHNNKIKKIISDARKKWLKENPDKHPWKNNIKFISNPCEKLKEKLKECNINFVEELTPLKYKNYSIDIAIINKRIGLEVNGNQHYKSDKTLKPYYENRKNKIEQNGWKLIDIHYSLVYKEDFIANLILFIKEQKKLDLNFDFIEKKKNYCECGKEISKNAKRCEKCYFEYRRNCNHKKIKKYCECGKEISKKTKKCITCSKIIKQKNYCECGKEILQKTKMCNVCYQISQRKVERPAYEQLLVEIKKLGYCGVGKKYGVSDNTIRKWKKYYETTFTKMKVHET